MPRAIWSGAISFGLVNVPVKLHTAVRKQDIHFHQLHEKDGARIQQKRVCSKEDKEVPWEEIVKGYELSKGHYVMIEPDELEALDPEATHTIDIEDFVDLDDIDPIYFDATYYLVPDKRGEKPYRLLHDAMADAGKVGIGRVVLRTKQYLAAIRPMDHALMLNTMNFADEVVPVSDFDDVPTGNAAKPSSKEMQMAQRLIESLATDFKPEKYEDDYRERVLDLIKKKSKGDALVSEPSEEKKAPIVDLMAALEASLNEARSGTKPTRGTAKRATKKRAAPKKAAAKKTAARRKAS
ncbi:MAG: Ku protein [Actinobacteria bacterium]|nr:Ku protein [Actinomycetota bacterium]